MPPSPERPSDRDTLPLYGLTGLVQKSGHKGEKQGHSVLRKKFLMNNLDPMWRAELCDAAIGMENG